MALAQLAINFGKLEVPSHFANQISSLNVSLMPTRQQLEQTLNWIVGVCVCVCLCAGLVRCPDVGHLIAPDCDFCIRAAA